MLFELYFIFILSKTDNSWMKSDVCLSFCTYLLTFIYLPFFLCLHNCISIYPVPFKTYLIHPCEKKERRTITKIKKFSQVSFITCITEIQRDTIYLWKSFLCLTVSDFKLSNSCSYWAFKNKKWEAEEKKEFQETVLFVKI